MSVTFFLEKHQEFALERNPDFIETEPEDPIFNPRLLEVDIYPTLNIANVNYYDFAKEIGLTNPENYHGSIKFNELDEFVMKLNRLENNCTNGRMLRYYKQLDKICRYALALKDNVNWC